MRKELSQTKRNISRSIKRSFHRKTVVENIQANWVKVLIKVEFSKLTDGKDRKETCATLITALKKFNKKHPHPAIAAVLESLIYQKDGGYICNLISFQQRNMQTNANYSWLESIDGPIFIDLDNPKNNKFLKVSLLLIATAKILSTCYYVPAREEKTEFEPPSFIEEDLAYIEEKILEEKKGRMKAFCNFLSSIRILNCLIKKKYYNLSSIHYVKKKTTKRQLLLLKNNENIYLLTMCTHQICAIA